MKFNSVKEYFFRLSNTGYQLMMVPLIVFIYHYASVYAFTLPVWMVDTDLVSLLLMCAAAVVLPALTAVHFFVRVRAAKISKLTGLGVKLEQLGDVLMKQLIALALITLVMPLGLVFTHHLGFAIGFIVLLAWFFFNWPTPARVSDLLKLKGDEKEMVLSRGEAFK